MAIIAKHLELLPVNDSDIRPSDSIKQTLLGKSCINLSFQSLSTISRLQKQSLLNSQELAGVRFGSSQSTLHQYNKQLEQLLITILQIPCVSDFNRTKLTEHYRKYKININNNKILPSNGYCENLMFTNFKNWGGMYGTIGFYINLLEEYNEYLTPSQIVFKSTLGLLQYIDSIQLEKLLFNEEDQVANVVIRINNRFRNLMSQDRQGADSDIYNLFKETIVDLKLSETYTSLLFLERFIPELMKWYFKRFDRNKRVEPPQYPTDVKSQAAYDTLIQAAKACVFYGVDEYNIQKLGLGFIHQFISPRYFDLFADLIRVKNTTGYVQTDTAPVNTEQALVESFLDNLNVSINPNRLRNDSTIILQNVAPPGGFNMWLAILAANLLNRAYIFTHRSNTPDTEDVENSRIYKRAIVLQVKAGLLLLKASLKELQVFGLNIISMTNIELEGIDPANLLDI